MRAALSALARARSCTQAGATSRVKRRRRWPQRRRRQSIRWNPKRIWPNGIESRQPPYATASLRPSSGSKLPLVGADCRPRAARSQSSGSKHSRALEQVHTHTSARARSSSFRLARKATNRLPARWQRRRRQPINVGSMSGRCDSSKSHFLRSAAAAALLCAVLLLA